MKILSALQSATKKLKKSTSPILDSEVLLSFVLNKSREFILAHPEKELTAAQKKKFRQLVARRSKGEPIAYLTGHKEFYGLDFLINKSVLIPRPETELLVDDVVALCHSEWSEESLTIVDVGTGSGCIVITLAKLFPRAKIFALDISKEVLSVAKKNAARHNVGQIKFFKSNLLKYLISNIQYLRDQHLIIVANLPYLTKKQMAEPSIQHEPRAALYGGKDGLEYYEELFKQIKLLDTRYFPDARSGSRLPYSQINMVRREILDIFCEIDPNQTSKIKKLIKKYLLTTKTEIKKDLAGHNRAVYASPQTH